MKTPKNNENQTEDSPSGKKLVFLSPSLRAHPDESPQEFAKRAMELLREAVKPKEENLSDQLASGESPPDAQKDTNVDAED